MLSHWARTGNTAHPVPTQEIEKQEYIRISPGPRSAVPTDGRLVKPCKAETWCLKGIDQEMLKLRLSAETVCKKMILEESRVSTPQAGASAALPHRVHLETHCKPTKI